MTYAILQQSIDSLPTVEQLQQAFAAIPGLTKYDGAMQAKDAYGILASGLPSNSAAALQKVLHDLGVETFVADEASLPVLPPAKTLTRADPLATGLVLYDALGRPQSLPWSDVVFLAAGKVLLTNFKRTYKDVVVSHGDRGGGVVVRDLDVEELHLPNMLIEIFLAGGDRYRIGAKKCSYAYLGASVSQRSSDNFLALSRDLLRLAPVAFRNRGAALLAGDPPKTMTYPTRHAFEEEITWCLWMKAQKGNP
jgi:hypothetical protein